MIGWAVRGEDISSVSIMRKRWNIEGIVIAMKASPLGVSGGAPCAKRVSIGARGDLLSATGLGSGCRCPCWTAPPSRLARAELGWGTWPDRTGPGWAFHMATQVVLVSNRGGWAEREGPQQPPRRCRGRWGPPQRPAAEPGKDSGKAYLFIRLNKPERKAFQLFFSLRIRSSSGSNYSSDFSYKYCLHFDLVEMSYVSLFHRR